MAHFRIALAQSGPILFDKPSNLKKAEEFIREAAAEKASLILFPELFLTGYSLSERAKSLAETPDGPSARFLAELALRQRIAVIMGYAELDLGGEHVYDSALIVDQHGQVSGSYRKIHLFQSEKGIFQPGNTPCILDLGFGKMGVLICYDLEFPEAARELALRGADWIAVSTGNMTPNQHLQEIYLQSRAAENRVWVCLANRVGEEPDHEFFGASGAADPFGNLAAQAGGSETLLVVDIDLTRAKLAYLNADYLTDRRSDLY